MRTIAAVALVWVGSAPATHAEAERTSDVAPAVEPVDLGRYAPLIPRNLLGLVHAPEVHEELGLNAEQVSGLEALFAAEVDGEWLRARNFNVEKQAPIYDRLEARVWAWFDEQANPQQSRRLRQLEYLSQGGRVLLRDDLAATLGVTDADRSALGELSIATQEAQVKLGRTTFGDPDIPRLREEQKKAADAERAKLTAIIETVPHSKVAREMGDPFDTKKLARIYPMAPEIVPVDDWINSPPLTMAELRGKVVVVHFYAYQCGNCHANFDVYQRWHDKLRDQGVVVLGIQTPETRSERDPENVRRAAAARDLDFPILVDVASENWRAWGNTVWPCVYVVDQDGYLRRWWQGELRWKGATGDQIIENTVNDLLQGG
ncbi:MAG: redoxin domain-containing protein [Planctomycetota bacterium]